MKTPISLKLVTADSPAERRPQAELIRGWLVEAGFDVTFEVFAGAEYLRRMNDERVHHLGITSTGVRTDPDGEFSVYSTSTAFYNPGRASQDPVQKQLDDLVKAGAATYDQKERKKVYDQIQRLQAQYVMGQIPLVYPIYTVAFRRNVKGTDKVWNVSTASTRLQYLWKE